MPSPSSNQRRRYTWSDYRSWPGDERWELIGGEAYAMSPSPSSRHQGIAMRLGARLDGHFGDGPCRVFAAPMDVCLSEEDVVQPDLLVVCDRERIQPTHIQGAPSLVVEILSDSSLVTDRRLKMDLYARAGVREYWIVTPFPSLVEVFALAGDAYRFVKAYGRDDTLASPLFPALSIPLARVFDFPLDPQELRVLEVREPPSAYA